MLLLSSASASDSDSDTDASIDIAAIISTRKMIMMFLRLNTIAASAFCLSRNTYLGLFISY